MGRGKLALALALAVVGGFAHADTLPKDIRAFQKDADLCDHFSGEPVEGDDQDSKRRAAFVDAKIRRYCNPLVPREKKLRVKYAKEARLLCVIDEAAREADSDRKPAPGCEE